MPSSSIVHPEDGQPWWKFPHVWMVLAGPALVVVAGIATAIIAAKDPDPLIPPSAAHASAPEGGERSLGLAPAVTGRNHAATPAQDRPLDK